GITSPIYLDEITTEGSLINTLQVPASVGVTSFSSKSELALNLSANGNYLTFMAYQAPFNALDVSNSNTPSVVDPTNPVGLSYYRQVIQLDTNGNFAATLTNAYSGNNGRAAVLASNGNYYTVGNAGNGGNPQPSGVVDGAGLQFIVPGAAPLLDPQPAGNFSVTQYGYPADKLGKDDNFRGLTIFNNTIYVTKGSGGNGINTVYQVGTPGTLPTPQNSTLPVTMTILPGFSTVLAKSTTGVTYPFGIWFANANTLYVADEGDGTAANDGTSKTSGLQKWVLINGTWQLAYVLQNGLNLGQQYNVPNYPATLNPAPDGLRNITGRVNTDGTVTIWAITSTVSASGDQGADPNQLVTIDDVLANTDPSVAAGEQFQVLRTAAYGEVLRGIAFTPGTTAPAAPASISVVSSGLTYSRRTQTFNGTVTITNNGSSAITGPYYVLFSGLTNGVTLTNGITHNGLPAVQVLGAGATLQPGQTASAAVSFSDPSFAVINYTPIVGQ
ncbi:MAG: hypothetical protein JO211_13710, partial [Acidobacteriaceae bacterium]|nr:hypothetical protein [Acidobacteriaceae bacterium]